MYLLVNNNNKKSSSTLKYQHWLEDQWVVDTYLFRLILKDI